MSAAGTSARDFASGPTEELLRLLLLAVERAQAIIPGCGGDQKICLSNALAELDGTPHQHKIIGQVVRLLLGHEPVPGAGGAEVDNDLVIQSYRLGAIIIERVDQRTGPAKWAVRSQFGECLSQSGDWEAEPSPSSRDTAFLERCRFPDEESAIAAARVSFGAGY